MMIDVELSRTDLVALRHDRLQVPRQDRLFELEGPGAVDCLQGLLTNDVRAAGEGRMVWGAILTPKGMIVSDAWVSPGERGARLIVPEAGHDAIAALLSRSIPPRLARVHDRGTAVAVSWLFGDVPEATDGIAILRPAGESPFRALALAERTTAREQLALAGWREVAPAVGDLAAMLLGWPVLGREIDDRTLPQEVRFDELGGVRYDKGCYTGQETVARLHFRGHANRSVKGLIWNEGATPGDRTVLVEGKNVGRVTTIGRVGERTIGLAMLRREVKLGATVLAGEAPATVTALPFDEHDARVA